MTWRGPTVRYISTASSNRSPDEFLGLTHEHLPQRREPPRTTDPQAPINWVLSHVEGSSYERVPQRMRGYPLLNPRSLSEAPHEPRDGVAVIEEASICELFVELPRPSPEIVIRLSGEPDRRQIGVLVDDKIYTDREPELMFAIAMWPDESVGSPSDHPNPASLLTLRGS